MSFLDDILSVGKDVFNFFTSNSIGRNIAGAAISAYALNKVTKSINKENEPAKIAETTPASKIDPGVRLQVNPNPEYRVPLVYGTAVLGGSITDAVLTNSNATMFYCITICEKTGNTGLGAGAASEFYFRQFYLDDQRLAIGTDGITVTGFYDRTETLNETISGQIKIYCYDGDSESPVAPYGYTVASLPNAYNVMPGWTSDHMMEGLVFAIVRVDYSSEKGVTGLGDLKFKMQNTMSQPGDCLYDYMTNTRYGAGIPAAEIYVS